MQPDQHLRLHGHNFKHAKFALIKQLEEPLKCWLKKGEDFWN